MAYRKNGNEKKYIEYRKSKRDNNCDFCMFDDKKSKRIIESTNNYWVVKNIFSYDTWDNLNVKKHFMIVPKKHIESLSQLSKDVLKEYAELMAKYESLGYSIYLRSMNNTSKSVQHLHIHLILLGNKPNKLYFFLKKPYFLWFK